MNLPARISNAQQALAQIETLEDALKVADLAAAARVWAKRANLGLEAQNEATAIKLMAEVKAGELLKAMKESGERGNGRPEKESPAATLSDLGISKSQSFRWQQLAGEVTVAEIEDLRDAATKKGAELTSAQIVKRMRIRDARRRTQERTREAAKLREQQEGMPPLRCDLHACSVLDLIERVEAGSVQAVITDPPYPHEYLDTYADLSRFAAHALAPGGICVALAGTTYLPDVFERMGRHLAYWWTYTVLFPGSSPFQWGRGILPEWRPLLAYVLPGERPRVYKRVDAFRTVGARRAPHKWGQSVPTFLDFVRVFSEPGDLIADPFLGGGTTALVANALGRPFVGCDIDPEATAMTRARFESAEAVDLLLEIQA